MAPKPLHTSLQNGSPPRTTEIENGQNSSFRSLNKKVEKLSPVKGGSFKKVISKDGGTSFNELRICKPKFPGLSDSPPEKLVQGYVEMLEQVNKL